MDASSWIAVLALLVSVVAPFLKAWIDRDKSVSDVRLVDAQTRTEWVQASRSMQQQINELSDELNEARELIRKMREDYEREIKLLRRRINRYAAQMRKAGIEPDDSEESE